MKNRPLCLVCIVLMAAILFCRFFRFPIFGEPELTPETRLLLTEGEEVHFAGILAAREPSGEKTRYTLRKCVVLLHGRELHLGRVMLTAQAGPEGARIGAGVSGKGTVRLLEPAGNPGQFDAAAYYACSRIYCRIWCEEPLLVRGGGGLRETLVHTRERVTSFYLASMPEGPAGIITAMLLGDKSLLTEESRRNFQVGGCLHMLVISGLHVTLLGSSVLRILLRIGLGQRPACMLAAALMCLYVLFTGLPVAAVRACIMFLTALLAKTRNLSYDSPSALAFAAILLLLVNPGYLFHAGFQLSFSAALGASVVTSLMGSGKPARGFSGKLRDSACSWCAIQLCTFPLLCYYYFEIPVWSLLLNLLLVPLVQYVLISGVAGGLAGLAFAPLGHILLLPADRLLRFFDLVLELGRRLPAATWICGQPSLPRIVVYYTILILFLWHRSAGGRKEIRQKNAAKRPKTTGLKLSHTGFLAGLILVLLIKPSPASFSLTMLDVGQGDCLVIREGRTIFLCDGGSTNVSEVGKYRILPYLESQGMRCVEGIFVSHDDADHINGVEEILRMIAERKTALKVGAVFMPAWMLQTESGKRIAQECHAAGVEYATLVSGDVFRFGETCIDVLHPFAEKGAQSGNAGSLVLRVTHGGFAALLTGDLEREGEEELLPYLTDIDVLKVGHHGSRHSTAEGFLGITKPEIALVSAPKRSFYGHPHPETLERLEACGALILATKDGGAVSMEVIRGELQIRTFLRATEKSAEVEEGSGKEGKRILIREEMHQVMCAVC